ncbi:Crp/Fnr family transcriptional regulator [Roseicyclus marinus]|uniref:HTH crp-type domain-containing protein n=1 Tax=Roseicyclus marinus TaxID=2161673 RepID=A0AA48HDY2_9RHOB|nr:hypothetical protein MACH21_26900 [Roseicyclus marinus]
MKGLNGPLRIRTVRNETRLQDETERPKIIGILRKGYLRTERILMDGRRSVFGFIVPGDLIGDIMGLGFGPAVVAATDAEICIFEPATFRHAITTDKAIRAEVLAEVMRQHTRQLEMVWRRGALNSKERIMAFIVLAAEFMPVEPLPDGSILLTMQVSRKDWADFCSSTLETISRTLTYLSERSMLRSVTPSRFLIRDMGSLAELAGLDRREDRKGMVITDGPRSSKIENNEPISPAILAKGPSDTSLPQGAMRTGGAIRRSYNGYHAH